MDGKVALAGLFPFRRQGMRFLRHVEDIPELLDGDVGLLELLPQAHQPQQGLRHSPGEHLERNQLADGELVSDDKLHPQVKHDDRHHPLEHARYGPGNI